MKGEKNDSERGNKIAQQSVSAKWKSQRERCKEQRNLVMMTY